MAPPGYGKTTTLSQWAARDGREFAWVSLDHRDNDPVVLLTYIAEALNADGTVEPAVFKALTATGDSLWASGLPRLGSALASRREPVVLVLDDVHELENHDCLDALIALLLHVPEGSQLVLSGRSEARLGLAKLRADGELLELGPAALALNDAEAHALLVAAGADVTETEAADAERARRGLGRRALPCGALTRRRQLVTRVVQRRRSLRHGLPEGRGARRASSRRS